jgi:GTP cyclohydrolase IA
MIIKKPTKTDAENAVRTLIAWAGDDPMRKELIETPARVVAAYQEFFCGYNIKIDNKITKTFDNIDNYNEMIILDNIDFQSHCEHHMVPIIGKASIAYIPDKKIIGLSKMARIVDIFAKRLQIQERLVTEIANLIDQIVNPKGVGVTIESSHHCLTTRGIHKDGSMMRTSCMLGCFKEREVKKEFFDLVKK